MLVRTAANALVNTHAGEDASEDSREHSPRSRCLTGRDSLLARGSSAVDVPEHFAPLWYAPGGRSASPDLWWGSRTDRASDPSPLWALSVGESHVWPP